MYGLNDQYYRTVLSPADNLFLFFYQTVIQSQLLQKISNSLDWFHISEVPNVGSSDRLQPLDNILSGQLLSG
jgi:hypothetical protein